MGKTHVCIASVRDTRFGRVVLAAVFAALLLLLLAPQARAQYPAAPGQGDVFSSCGNPYGCANRTYGTGSQAFHPGDAPCANPYGCAHSSGQGQPSAGGQGRFYGGASNDVYCQQSPGQPMYGPYHGTGTNTPCGPAFAPQQAQPAPTQPAPTQPTPPQPQPCGVFLVDGIPVWSRQASLSDPNPGIVLVQASPQDNSGQDNSGQGTSGQDNSGCTDQPAPRQPFNLSAQLTDAECAWYWGVSNAIAQAWQKYISDPQYAKPANGTKVLVDYVVIGKPFYSNGGIAWDGWRVSGNRQFQGLGFSWGRGMTARDLDLMKRFASRALSDVSEAQAQAENRGQTGPLTLLPDWQSAPPPQYRTYRGKQVFYGIHIQSSFSVSAGGPPHLYNVACIDWIRRYQDPNANPAPGSTPLLFVMQ